jgi:hypothetical protein
LVSNSLVMGKADPGKFVSWGSLSLSPEITAYDISEDLRNPG